MFEVVEGKLIKPAEEWHKFLEGKKLTLCTTWDKNWALGAIDEEDLTEFCKFIWDLEGDDHEYETLEDMLEDISLGNYGFNLLRDEVEVINILAKSDLI